MKSAENELLIDFDNRADEARLFACLRRLSGKHRVEIKRYRKRRSNPQNRFYWAVVVAMFRDFLNEQGEAVTSEEAHDLLRAKFLRVTLHDPRTREPIGESLRSSASLSTDEFAAYVENCVVWLADHFDIVCPSPDEHFDRKKVAA